MSVSKLKTASVQRAAITEAPPQRCTFYNRLTGKLEECRISQDILCRTMCIERRCTLCTASERHAVRRRKDKKDGASQDSEEV